MNSLDVDLLIRAALALVLVIGLIVLVAAAFRHFSAGGSGGGLMRRGQKRLALVESLGLDPKRRLVLVRRDGREHLLLLGATGDVVVESGITPPATPAAAGPRHPLDAMAEPTLNGSDAA